MPCEPRSEEVSFSNSGRPRILHVIESAGLGGAQRAMELILRGLADRGFEAAAALPFDGPLVERLRGYGVKCFELPIERRLDSRTGATIAELVRRHRFDLVHVHTPKAGMLARRAAKRAGAIVVMSVHGLGNRALMELPGLPLIERVKKTALVALERLADRSTDHFVLECRRDIARGFYPADRSTLITNGVDPAEFPSLDPSPRATLLFPARLSVQKDPFTLLKAVPLLEASGHRVTVQFAGGGELYGEVLAMARSLGIEDRLEFFEGARRGSDLYREAAVVVLATHFEGQPYAVLEAMASGRPVVASDVGAMAETLDEGTGVVVPPRDPVALAAALRALIENPAHTVEMVRRARLRVERLYTEERQVAEHTDLYERLLRTDR